MKIQVKVNFLDKPIRDSFLKISGGIGTALSTLLLFIEIPKEDRFIYLGAFAVVLSILYVLIWARGNRLKNVSIDIDGTSVAIKSGDIFQEPGLKVIAFNEYFDTEVNNRIINERSLNGIFLQSHLEGSVADLDQSISDFLFEEHEILERGVDRRFGKKTRFRLGTIFLKDDFILTAMSKFDSSNRATLTMPQYLEFLINFWDGINKVYAQRSVVTPVFGSGITRIKGHKNINDEDLLKIMLWTFRISEMRFKHPAKLTIMIHNEKINQVNLLEIAALGNGI